MPILCTNSAYGISNVAFVFAGSVAGSVRKDVLREPWFLATLLGSIGGILWLVFCIFSIWLYRRRRALISKKKMPKNTTVYTGKPSEFVSNEMLLAFFVIDLFLPRAVNQS